MVGDLADLRRVTSQSVPDACPWSAHAMPTRKAVARQLGLPCVVAVDGLDDVAAGRDILLDGSAGRVFVRPDPETAASAVTAYRASADRAARWTGLGATADGHRVEVLANVQDGTGAWAARRGPAEGVGLFRTELCFLDRESEPTAEEQMARYREVLDAYPEAKVVIRTLDAGSDKPLRFAGHVDEANPALGVRGFRIAARQRTARPPARRHRRSSRQQTRPVGDGRDDFHCGRSEGVRRPGPCPRAGARRHDRGARGRDHDRSHPRARRLRVDRHQRPRPVRDGRRPDMACVLAGFGITSLSAAATAIAAVGAELATGTIDDCNRAATAVLSTTDPQAARAAARSVLAGGYILVRPSTMFVNRFTSAAQQSDGQPLSPRTVPSTSVPAVGSFWTGLFMKSSIVT